MTPFEFEIAEIARLDRRMVSDIGLVEGEGPHPSQLRKLPVRTSSLSALVSAVLARLTVRGLSAPAAR